MRSWARWRNGRVRSRLVLYLAAVGILFVSGGLAASGIVGLVSLGVGRWIQFAPNFALAIFGFLVTVLLVYAARREREMIALFEWLRGLDKVLAGLGAPLTADNLEAPCKELASLFPRNAGWVMLVRAPGLLIRGEVRRRRYLPIVAKEISGKWNVSWVENYLKDLMEGQGDRKEIVTSVKDEEGKQRPLGCWVSRNRAGDITAGMAIAQARGRSRRDAVTLQAVSTGMDMVVQRIGSILVEVIERREGLGIENLGLVMRVLAHEINSDLQGALNSMDAASLRSRSLTEEATTNLRALLARASHWSHLMREAPFLVDKVLPFERNVVSLPAYLRETLEEVRQAWPDVAFVVRMPESGEDILVTGDQHLRSVLRNLLHNAASYSPEEGMVEIRVEEDEERARVQVRDEGPGVDPADVDKIFAPVESMREGRRTGARVDYGMGVGLTISRAIARAYGGELVCHSNASGGGGVFEVILPLEREAPSGEKEKGDRAEA